MPPSWGSLIKKYVRRHKEKVSNIRGELAYLIAIGPVSSVLAYPISEIASIETSTVFVGLFALLFITSDSATEENSDSISDVLIYTIPWMLSSIFVSFVVGSSIVSLFGQNISAISVLFSTTISVLYILVAMSAYGIVMCLIGIGIKDLSAKAVESYQSDREVEKKDKKSTNSPNKETQRTKE